MWLTEQHFRLSVQSCDGAEGSAVTVCELSHSVANDAIEDVSNVEPVDGESFEKFVG
jgi:hypothetical protein